MSYEILTIPPFDKQLKKLSKKYPSLKSEFADLIDQLSDNPELGTPLGKNCFKIRIAIASKGKGKSGGARIIAHLTVQNKTIYLLAIYDKKEIENLTDKELSDLLNRIKE